MQTAIEDMQLTDKNVELPFRDFEDFMIGVLLPNPSGKAAALAEFEVSRKRGNGMALFSAQTFFHP